MSASLDTAPYTGSVMFIDPSGQGKDETSYAVVKMLHSKLFLTAAGGFRDGFSEKTLGQLAGICKEQKVNHVLVEKNFGDGMFTALLQPVLTKVHPVVVEEIRHTGQKERRICDTLEPVLNQHKLVVDQAVIERDLETEDKSYSLFYQLTRLTREKGALVHDDRIEAVAGAVAYWVTQLAVDEGALADAWRDEQLQKELDGWFESNTGIRPGPVVWQGAMPIPMR
jgi:hypothetical protein